MRRIKGAPKISLIVGTRSQFLSAISRSTHRKERAHGEEVGVVERGGRGHLRDCGAVCGAGGGGGG